MKEERKIEIAKQLSEILPHRNEVRNQFGGINRISDLPEEVYENLFKLILEVDKEAEERGREEIKRELTGDLLPILDATHKWLKAHDRADEILFNKISEDNGSVREVPTTAIYMSPIAKFQSVATK